MKRFIDFCKYLVLIGLMVFCLAGCGEDNKDNKTEDNPDEPIVEKDKVTVSFETGCDAVINSVTIEKDSLIDEPVQPTKTGYTFVGWVYNGVDWLFKEFSATTDMTLVAKWKVNKYTLTYKLSSDDEGQSYQVDFGSKVTLVSGPNKVGYSFEGWSYNGEIISIIENMPANNIEVYANWKVLLHTITYKYNDGVTPDLVIEKEYNSKIDVIEDPTREGYSFIGWDTTLPLTMPNGDIVVNALWADRDYTLTIKNYGQNKEDYVVTQRANSKLNIPNPTVFGYSFTGYTTADNGKGIKVVLDKMFLSDMVLYANYSLTEYTISYETDGATIDGTLVTKYTIELNETTLIVPTKAGYIFRGWQENGQVVTSISGSMARDITLVAKFDKVINDLELSNETKNNVYNELEITPVIVDKNTTECTYTGELSAKTVGTYKIKAVPNNGYCWADGTKTVREVTWNIIPLELTVTWSNTEYVYDGEEHTVTCNVVDGNGTSYEAVLQGSCTNAGSVTVTLERVNNCSVAEMANYTLSSDSTTLTISQRPITNVQVENDHFVYDGTKKTVKITSVNASGLECTTYQVQYDEDAIEVSGYQYHITGTGNYSGTITDVYFVVKAPSKFAPISDVVELYAENKSYDIKDYLVNYCGNIRITGITEIKELLVSVNNLMLTINSFSGDEDQTTIINLEDSGDSRYLPGTATLTIKFKKVPVTLLCDKFDSIRVDERFDLNGLNVEVAALLNSDHLIYANPTFTVENTIYASLNNTMVTGLNYSNNNTIKYTISVPGTKTCKSIEIEKEFKVERGNKLANAILVGNGDFNETYSIVSNITEECTYQWYKTRNGSRSNFYGETNSSFTLDGTYNDHIYILDSYYLGCRVSVKNNSDNYETVYLETPKIIEATKAKAVDMYYVTPITYFVIQGSSDVAEVITYWDSNAFGVDIVNSTDFRLFVYNSTNPVAGEFKRIYRGTDNRIYVVSSLINPVVNVGSNYSGNSLTSYGTSNSTSVEHVLSYANGNLITSIADNAFTTGSTVSEIYIAETITQIGNNAFNRSSIENVYFYMNKERFLSTFDNVNSWGISLDKIVLLNDNGEYETGLITASDL